MQLPIGPDAEDDATLRPIMAVPLTAFAVPEWQLPSDGAVSGKRRGRADEHTGMRKDSVMIYSDDGLTASDDQAPPWGTPIGRPGLHEEDADDAGWLSAERRMLEAGQELMSALAAFEYEAARYRDEPLACLEFDDAMGSLSSMYGRMEKELSQWRTAMDLIENDTQIAPRSERGVVWRPYLSPRWLLYFADLAKPGDPGYIPQLLARLAEEDERRRAQERELALVCGRPTKSGQRCQSIPVFWPGRGRVAACNRHLSPEEKTDLGKAWSEVEELHSCPGCKVPSGVPCDETVALQVLPSGEFPKARTFAGRMMHDVRLKLGEPAGG